MDELNTLSALGITMPSPAYLAGALMFSIFGYAAYRYGKKMEQPYRKWIGVVLMLYPYGVSDTLWMYVVGGLLCVALYFVRE